ncbi:protein kinase [Spirulina sp. CS-785/01]|uniref:serine/threonine protein kinase n=1 Tax=Spirulina sp. CS-785/01 TaxID=3021716 RepID=UPI00232E4025|nr:protein kinase [Spirulina sp. CS-785/01]MDB9313697.1 protein kinase [Spirulina sp. CS-785/01]
MDTATQRYQLLEELKPNYQGQTRTVVAQDNITDKRVVIKEFYVQDATTLKYFKQYYRDRVKQVEALSNPALSKYLYAFKTSRSLCLVREHISGKSLEDYKNFDPAFIKNLILKLLDTLIDLQKKVPAIFHLNLKPKNILITPKKQVYLTDFQVFPTSPTAQNGKNYSFTESGFTAPEQFNNSPTKATDLYSLGVALICFLTETPSEDVHFLINQENRFVFRDRLNFLNPQFLNWLEKLVEPDQRDRFSSAIKAKTVFKSISVAKIPEIPLRHPGLIFQATRKGQKVTQTLKLRRIIPTSVKEGVWEIATHPSDQPYVSQQHPWIKISPSQFHRSKLECRITVDTSRLIPEQVYERQIILHQYHPKERKYFLPITVKTAKLNASQSHPLQKFLKPFLPLIRSNPQQKAYNPSEEEIRLSLSRFGTPSWTEEDFQRLIQVLGEAGYGWLSPEGVRQQLERMKINFEQNKDSFN